MIVFAQVAPDAPPHPAPGKIWGHTVEICLHLGAHRTGTTGLQHALAHHRDHLWDAGVAYWGPARTRGGLMAGLMKNPNTLGAQDAQAGRRSLGRLRMEIARMRNEGCAQVLISEENLLGNMAQNLLFGRPYPQAGDRLARIAPAFAGYGIRIGLCIRSYERHWASQLAYRIESGAAVPNRAQLDRLTTQPRRWRTVIRDVARAFPDAEIVVWAYEGVAGNALRMLPAILAHDPGLRSGGAARPVNASLSATALRALAHERGDAPGAARLAHMQGRYAPFDLNQTLKMQGDYHEDLTWLEAGAEGLATYLDPTGDTSGGHDMTEGSHHDGQDRGQDRSLARAR